MREPDKILLKKLEDYFTTNIDAKSYAIYMRKFIYSCLMLYLQSDMQETYKDDIENGYYHLVELMEVIDPSFKN